MEKTTIQISLGTLERLKALKNVERESYDDVLNVMIESYEEETLTEEEIEDIKIALENVKGGRVKPIEKVARELGIALT